MKLHLLWVVSGMALCYLATTSSTRAQIVPDATLTINSSVTTEGNTSIITGGTKAGGNLFHSFEQFSVPTGSRAYFNNASDIQNIISRVTGASISNIDGLLKANGTANLFLINPNGIIFGPNASLNIGGSFITSTANSLNFADGTQFSANASETKPLLTMSVPIGLQYGENPGRILVQGDGQGIRTTSDLIDTTAGLRVQPHQTLALVGGDVSLEGGTLKTAGGRIELGSVAGPGLVNLSPTDKGWALGYEGVATFGDIQLSSTAAVDASGAGSGDIQVWGRRAILKDGSEVESSTLGAEPGGTLSVTTSDLVELIGHSTDNLSGLFALVYQGAKGTGGNLTIKTGQLIVRDGAQLATDTFGEGTGGTLAIRTLESVGVIGTTADGKVPSSLSTSVREGATGSGGNLTLETGRLLVRDGAQIVVNTWDAGSAGSLAVEAHDLVEVIGRSSLSTSTEATGAGGNLTLETGRLLIRDGARIFAVTSGTGSAGSLVVEARDSIELSGTSLDGRSSALGTQVTKRGTGAGGNLTLATGRLLVRDGAQISAATLGAGPAGALTVGASDSVELYGTNSGLFTSVARGATGAGGNLTLATGRLLVRDGARVSAGTLGKGSSGTLAVEVRDLVELIGMSADGEDPSGLWAAVDPEATGAGGNLTLATRRLIVRDGAQVFAGTLGEGAGGTITVRASEAVELSGIFSAFKKYAPSGIFTVSQGAGNAGDLTIETAHLTVRDGAQVSADTQREGAGGTLAVRASESLELSGTSAEGRFFSFLTASTMGTGNAGDLIVETGQLTLRDGAKVTVSSTGSGNAGELQVQARSIQMDKQADITATSRSGNGGDINLRAYDLLLMRRGSSISTSAGTAQAGGNGGNITIKSPFIVSLEDSDITANAFSGNGGQVQITAQGIFGTQFREQPTSESDITASSRFGVNGQVTLNTPDIDPSRSLNTLPTAPVDVTKLVAQGCPAGGAVGRGVSAFVVTGRGGLPPTPQQMLSSDTILEDWGTLALASAQPQSELQRDHPENRSSIAAVATTSTHPTPATIVEAQGWVIGANGEVLLTADAPTIKPYSSRLNLANCYGS